MIKIWDLRQMKRPKSEVAASAENRYELKMAADCPAPNYSKRPHGITCLVVHEGSNRMLASCSDNCHYLFDALRPDQGAITSFGGHQTRSFYVKADFSPCGTHFVSGSSNKNLHIWQARYPGAQCPVPHGFFAYRSEPVC